jgi:hypothetical protein
MTSAQGSAARVPAEINPPDRWQQAQSAARYLTHPAVIKAVIISLVWAVSVVQRFSWWWEGTRQWWRPVSHPRERR